MRKSTVFIVLLTLLSLQGCSQNKTEKHMEYTKLTPEEERVIIHKGTETPFTGTYDDFWEKGTGCVFCSFWFHRWKAGKTIF